MRIWQAQTPRHRREIAPGDLLQSDPHRDMMSPQTMDLIADR